MINHPRLRQKALREVDFKIGKIYLFENFLITEFNEGVDINFDNFNAITQLIKSHFGARDFGFIANRRHSYSINLNDAPKFNATFPNLKAYAVITYTLVTERVFELENHFFTFNRKAFRQLEDGVDWVKFSLADSK